MEDRSPGLKSPVCASLALAFASLGDAFLYPYLPLNGMQAGVPMVWVGLLLSVNRFVRIIANSLATQLFALYGLRLVSIAAVILAIISTAGYSVSAGIITWVTFRILWGLSYSALRISTIGYALDHSKPGLALGLSKSLQELGPLSVLFLAPLIMQYASPKVIFILLSIASLPALYFAIKLPATHHKPVLPKMKLAVCFPSVFNTITFVSAFLIDGLLIVTLGILFLHYENNITAFEATALAAAYLAYRRICIVGLSAIGGWMADKVGFEKIFLTCLFFIISGMFVIAWGSIAFGAAVVFLFYGVFSAITPGSALQTHPSALHAVAQNATWRDVGAATGALIAGLLLSSSHLSTTLFIATFALLTLFFVKINTAYKAGKVFFSWKQ